MRYLPWLGLTGYYAVVAFALLPSFAWAALIPIGILLGVFAGKELT